MALVITKKTRTILFIVLGVLVVGGGGFLFWRINQQDTVAPTDSDASGCIISRVAGDTCRNRGAGQCNEDEAGAGTLCCKPYKKTCTYTLRYVAGTGGAITGNATQTITNEYITDGSLNKNTPEPSTVTATPNAGYKFEKWSDGSTTASRTDQPKDATYTATFEVVPVETVTLTYTAGANGKITGTTPQIINKGASGTAVTATPNTGYAFEKWSDNKTTAARTDTNVQASATYTATFKSTSPTAPVNCTGFTLSCGSNNTININWNLVPGATQYIARINKEPKSDWLNKEGGDVWISFTDNVNSYVIENAQSGAVYGVNVVAYSGPDGEKDFHPSCNLTSLGQVWDPPMYSEISCQGTTPIVVPPSDEIPPSYEVPPSGEVPQTGVLDTVLGRVSLGISFIFLGGLVTQYSAINTFYNGVVEKAQFRADVRKDVRKEKRVAKRRDKLERKFK
ncbi:MAG: hypothetical protein PHG60_00775 [Candidatus Dojkabacteria bacterium]|nr:hypothetical protein [Candidatus Dojkabacteria bacterium]